jgi:hypothetical protein
LPLYFLDEVYHSPAAISRKPCRGCARPSIHRAFVGRSLLYTPV